MIKRIAFALFWVVCFSIYLYVEYTYQVGYEKSRKQQEIEHNFYEQYKDSIK